MMNDREALHGLIGLSGLLGFGGFILFFLQPPGSAEQVLSICSGLMGGALFALIVLVTRLRRPRSE
jgi:ABC-type uncharacterized transport system permease subunit